MILQCETAFEESPAAACEGIDLLADRSGGRGLAGWNTWPAPRDAVESVVLSRVLVEHRGDGGLRAVERVLKQPPAAPRAVDAALIAGVHEAPARAGINGQIHADTEQLALLSSRRRRMTTMIYAPPELAKHLAALERLRRDDAVGRPEPAGRPALAGRFGWQGKAVCRGAEAVR